MKRQLAILLFSLTLAMTPAAFAKGKTVKIVLEGADLSAPVEMTEPGLEVFGVWEGPGVRVDGVEQTEGFIIDWPQGTMSERPAGLQQYKVCFYVEGRQEAKLAYVVFYEYDASTSRGYVYLPPVELNSRTIYRGVEGNWFRSTADWEEAVRQALSRTTAGSPRA